MTKLLVIKGNDRGKQFELLTDDLTSVGRDPKNAVQLGDAEVSRVHAIIKLTENGFVIADKNSSNGTFVNEQRVRQHLLESRDLIRMGQTTLVFDSSPIVSMVDVRSMVTIGGNGENPEDASSSLELGRTMMVDAKIVFLDEVGAGVNRTLLNTIGDAIIRLNKDRGYTFCMIEHDMDFIGRLCDPVIVMAEGTVLVEGAPGEVMANEAVIEAYLGTGLKNKPAKTGTPA